MSENSPFRAAFMLPRAYGVRRAFQEQTTVLLKPRAQCFVLRIIRARAVLSVVPVNGPDTTMTTASEISNFLEEVCDFSAGPGYTDGLGSRNQQISAKFDDFLCKAVPVS